MKIIVAGSYRTAVYYTVLRGWPRHSVKIVTEPTMLRGLGQGAEIIMLEPRQQYRFTWYMEFLSLLRWMEKTGRATVLHDDLDNWV